MCDGDQSCCAVLTEMGCVAREGGGGQRAAQPAPQRNAHTTACTEERRKNVFYATLFCRVTSQQQEAAATRRGRHTAGSNSPGPQTYSWSTTASSSVSLKRCQHYCLNRRPRTLKKNHGAGAVTMSSRLLHVIRKADHGS